MVTIQKIGNDKIKIDGIEISIRDYNGYRDGDMNKGLSGWYKDDERAIKDEYQKLSEEIHVSQSKKNPKTGEFYTTEEYHKELEKIKKVNWSGYQEAEKIQEQINSLSESFHRIFSTSLGDSVDDDEEKIRKSVEFNNERIKERLELYQKVLPGLRQLYTQKKDTGNGEWGGDYNDPNKDKTREELGRRAKEIEAHRNKVKEEIEKALNQDPQITSAELDPKYQSWEERIWSTIIATGEKEIDEIKEQVLTDISIKRTAKKASKEKRNEFEKLVDETKTNALQKIAAALQSARLVATDLSSDCQNWREQIEQAATEDNVNKIQDIEAKVLVDIPNRRNQKIEDQKQQDEKIAEEINKATKEDIDKMADDQLAESLALFTRWEGESKYKGTENLEEAQKVLKDRNPALYRQKSIEAIKERLSDYGVDEAGLSELTQELIEGKFTDLEKFDTAKLQAIREIGEKGAENKWTSLFKQAQSLLEKAKKNVTKQVKNDIKKIQEQMKNFKSGTNSYLSSVYQQHKSEADKLEKALSRFSTNSNQTGSPKGTPWGIIIPVSLVALTLIGIAAVIIVRKSKQNSQKKNS